MPSYCVFFDFLLCVVDFAILDGGLFDFLCLPMLFADLDKFVVSLF